MSARDLFQKDCRFFSGYKPCGKNDVCSSRCGHKKVAHPHILIVHLEALGAVLRGTVVLRAIKRQWPEAHITWVTSPLASSLLENNPLIDRLVKNDHNGILSLKTLKFDFGFCIDKSLNAAGILACTAGIAEKRGFGVDPEKGIIIPLNPEAQRLYELGLSNSEKFFVNKKSENQLIIESLGLEFQDDEYVFEFTEKENLFKAEEQKRLALQDESFVIGLNTGCSSVIPYKKLTVAGWLSLIDLLILKFPDSKILLLGGPEDTQRNGAISESRHGDRVLMTPTETGLRNGMIYVDLCDAVITGDSLGLHMAIARKKWVTAWFGPTCAHEIDFYSRGMAVLTKSPCSPCWKRQCEKAVMCYDQVDFNEVVSSLDMATKARPKSESPLCFDFQTEALTLKS